MKKFLKTIFIAVSVLTVAVLSAACSKDNDGKRDISPVKTLAGTEWRLDVTLGIQNDTVIHKLNSYDVETDIINIQLKFVNDSAYTVGVELLNVLPVDFEEGKVLIDPETGNPFRHSLMFEGKGKYSFSYPKAILTECDYFPVKNTGEYLGKTSPAENFINDMTVVLTLTEDGHFLDPDPDFKKILTEYLFRLIPADPGFTFTIVSDLQFYQHVSLDDIL